MKLAPLQDQRVAKFQSNQKMIDVTLSFFANTLKLWNIQFKDVNDFKLVVKKQLKLPRYKHF